MRRLHALECERRARVVVVVDPVVELHLGFTLVARALAYGDSRVLRAYARDGRTMIASSGALLDQALVIASGRRKLAEFENHLLPKTTTSDVTLRSVPA